MTAAIVGKIVEHLPGDARVVDVGGGASPCPRADVVIDAVAYRDRGKLGVAATGQAQRYDESTWIQVDLCGRERWPIPDKSFDYAICSHVLEDLRDPIRVCTELQRIAKAGYIGTPSRILEQSRGIEHPLYAGYYHYRWLVSVEDGCLCFRFKPHSLHSIRAAIVADIGVTRKLNPEYVSLDFEWSGGFECREVLEFEESAVNAELCRFAENARRLPDLTVPSADPLARKLKKGVYYWRLRRGLA